MSKLAPIRKAPTEAQLWRRIKKDLHRDYDRAYRVEAVNTPGFPDAVWVPYKRFPVLIELKAGPLKFREAQRKFINDMHAIGTTVWVVWQAHVRDEPVVWRGVEIMRKPWREDARGFTFLDWAEQMRDFIGCGIS